MKITAGDCREFDMAPAREHARMVVAAHLDRARNLKAMEMPNEPVYLAEWVAGRKGKADERI